MENLKKAEKIIKSPALAAIYMWSKPVRWPVVSVSGLSVISTLVSLSLTLVMKALVDAATGGDVSLLWHTNGCLIRITARAIGMDVISTGQNISKVTTAFAGYGHKSYSG